MPTDHGCRPFSSSFYLVMGVDTTTSSFPFDEGKHDFGEIRSRLRRVVPVAAASWNLRQRCCNDLSGELEPRCGMLQWHPRRAGIGSRPHAMIRHVVVQPAIFFARTSLFLLEPTFLPQLQRARRAICYDQSFSLLEPSVFFAGTKFLQELW